MNTPNENPAEPIQAQTHANSDGEIAQNEEYPASAPPAEPKNPPSHGENDEATHRRHKIANLRKAGVFWLEIGTFIALIAYATITKNQWEQSIIATNAATSAAKTANDTLAEIKKGGTDTHAVAEAAKTSAEAAKISADISRLQSRAYMTMRLTLEDALKFKPEWHMILATLHFINSGSSPAANVVTLYSDVIDKAHDDPGDNCRSVKRLRMTKGGRYSKAVKAPQGILTITRAIRDDGTEWFRYQHGDDVVCVFGSVFYDDIFGDSHETEFCVFSVNSGNWGDCVDHNKMYDYPKPNNPLPNN